ncbi:DUF6443 domain-containing protein, partial [uncultured Winogradskyella sp.]|uniref:DUF6443 domain-containing protein n=1 Tax=uncultured Winogradskyella sp. TaxID=395353 RepID=UPI0026197F1C
MKRQRNITSLTPFMMLLGFVLLSIQAYAQNLSGLTPVTVGNTETYTYNDGNIKPNLSWNIIGGTQVSSSSSGTTYTVDVTWPTIGTHKVEARGKSNSLLESMDVVVQAAPPTTSVALLNYIHNITPRIATTDITTLSNNEKIESITYFDGLGRASQSIGIRAGGQSQDIITHIAYDAFGRQTKEYLPYSATTNIGDFRVDAFDATNSYYDATAYDDDFPGMSVADINPYSEKEFDSSPLNRVMKQAAPGKDWKMGNGHEIEMDYLTNGTNEVKHYYVKLFKDVTNSVITYTTSLEDNGYYTANELSKTITKDENHDGTSTKAHTTEEFKNKQGQVILKRTYGTSEVDGVAQTNVAHDTYYVYDDYGNLSFVLPPKAEAHTAKPDPTELSELCYQYIYDDLNRLVEKKIPGKGWEYIVYNKLDQPIATQDAIQRGSAPYKWLITKYDAFGRVAYTAIEESNTLYTRTAVQDVINGQTQQYETRLTTPITVAGTTLYYTNASGFMHLEELLTINYYDDYNFDLDGGSSETAYGVTPITNVKGLATGSKVRVLGTNDWITTVTYYDDKARPIYVYSKNAYLDTVDKIKSDLTFDGRATETTSSKERSGITLSFIDQYTYDHTNRVLEHRNKFAHAPLYEVITDNSYDDLGQLTAKGVGGKQNAIDRLQDIDYT